LGVFFATDLGQAGDLTSDAIVPATLVTRAAFTARQPGVIAGLDRHACGYKLANDGHDTRSLQAYLSIR
jgi:nicotinate-nucleotide pyrophosphorylase (carboxylating)